jgi:hypothetical protein
VPERCTIRIVATHPTVFDRARRAEGITRLLESHGFTVQRIDLTPIDELGGRVPELPPLPAPTDHCDGMGV